MAQGGLPDLLLPPGEDPPAPPNSGTPQDLGTHPGLAQLLQNLGRLLGGDGLSPPLQLQLRQAEDSLCRARGLWLHLELLWRLLGELIRDPRDLEPAVLQALEQRLSQARLRRGPPEIARLLPPPEPPQLLPRLLPELQRRLREKRDQLREFLLGPPKIPQIHPKIPQIHPKIPQNPQNLPKTPQNRPQNLTKTPQNLPETPQNLPKMPQIPPKIPENPPKMPQNPPKMPQNLPKIPEIPPKMPQNPPKNPPQIPQNPPEIPPNFPKFPPNLPKMPQNPPKMPQNPPQMPQNPPKMPQNLPKIPEIPPKMPQNPPKMPQNPPKMPQNPPEPPPNFPEPPPDLPGSPKNAEIPPKMAQNGPNLGELLGAERLRLRRERLRERRLREELRRTGWEYPQVLLRSLSLLSQLRSLGALQAHLDGGRGQFLLAKGGAVLLKSRLEELQILLDTYPAPTIEAHRRIRAGLSEARRDAEAEAAILGAELAALRGLGPEFRGLALELGRIRQELAQKGWALHQLRPPPL